MTLPNAVEDVMQCDVFSRHPHRRIQTVTIVLDQALEHYDSASRSGVIGAGDAQWMAAGHDVVHNENALPGTSARILHLWIQPFRIGQNGATALPGHA